jgi:YVTN family beta-propeller protein
MTTIALGVLTGVVSAPSATDRVSIVANGDCTAGEKARRQRAQATYLRTMMRKRRAFFRAHKNVRARRAFVRRQQAKLRALRKAAACTVTPPGARVIATISIPNSGGVGVGAGSVWTIDRGQTRLVRIDPVANGVVAQIPGVVGAAPVVGENAVWVPSAIANRLFRADFTGMVTEIATGPSADEWPIAAVVTGGAVWVGNHHSGTIVRVDPRTNTVVASVRWGEHANGGIYHMAADGSSIWVTASRTSDVSEIDAATNAVVRRTPVPTGACGGVTVDASAVWVTSGFDRPYPCWQRANWGLSRIDRATGAVTRIDVGGRPFDVRVAFGAVWVVVDAPRLALVRLDPTTYRVVGRLPLASGQCLPETTGNCLGAEYATALEVGFGSLWVRRSVAPNLPFGNQAPGAVLRIEPWG